MPNTLLTSSEITLEALRILKNQLNFANRVNRQYDNRFALAGAKIGETLSIRKPVRYIGEEGPAITTMEDITEEFVPVTLNRQCHVPMEFTTKELTLSIDEFSRRIVAPAVATLANKIDLAVAELYKQVPYYVGTVGTIPQDLDIYLNAGAKLNDNMAPLDNQRFLTITPKMEARIVFALRGLFQSSTQIKAQYEKGTMGLAAGFEWAMDQNCWTHTVGAIAGTPTVTNAGQTGSSIITQAWGANATLKRGDVLTFAGSYQVNGQNRQSNGDLQQFVVTADTAADGAGAMTIPISPDIITAGARQTVDASPAAGALISVFGTAAAGFAALAGRTSPQGMAFHRDFGTLVCCDLYMPKNVEMSARIADDDLGISMRFVRQYDAYRDKIVNRLDVLFGVACLRPELACRVIA